MELLNRLKSIYYDSRQVSELQQMIPNSEIIANLRCGKWYCSDPNVKTCYFKSTDGHNGQWDFNTRRLNMNVLELILTDVPTIIVDATANHRKVYPDALSKTVPIWITVLNHYLMKLSKVYSKTQIHLPNTISNNEKHNLLTHISKKIDDWVLEFENILDSETLLKLKNIISKREFRPIIPIFVSSNDIFNIEYYSSIKDIGIPVILLSVGNNDRICIENQEDRNFQYILGAGDDEDMWSIKITADRFWNDYKRLLDCKNDIEIKTILCAGQHMCNDILSLFDNSILFVNRTHQDVENVVSIKVHTDNATYFKNIGKYTLPKYRLDHILHNLLHTIVKLRRYHIIKIEFICNDFKISLALLVSIFVKFKNSIFISSLNLTQNDEITKDYIRKIISYLHQFSGRYQLTRNCCQELNQYFIDRPN